MTEAEDDQLDKLREKLVERLPETLREDWIVVPKRMPLQVFLVGLLFGASLALMIVGFVIDERRLVWGWPLVTACLMAATKWWPWWRGDRSRDQLRVVRDDGAAEQA